MDTPLSILERAERETLLVSQHYELLHVHTLGTWGSSRGDVRSMSRKGTRVMWRGNKMNETSKKTVLEDPLCPGLLIHILGHPTSHSNVGFDLRLSGLNIYMKSIRYGSHGRRADVVGNGAAEGMLKPKLFSA